jgi:glutamine amidotransferase
MRALARLDLIGSLKEYAASGRPFLGVCVGLQLLFDGSEEGGGVECLGIMPGTVRRFPPGLKVPQIGWNDVSFRFEHALLRAIPSGSYFYFVHSYYAEPASQSMTLGTAEYGVDFAALVANDNVVATQFHPEKSADMGLQIYRNFADIVDAQRESERVSAYSRR